jgi:hypothetical protein
MKIKTQVKEMKEAHTKEAINIERVVYAKEKGT